MGFKDLVVWQKSHALAVQIIKASEIAPSSYASRVCMTQLVRAATSVSANIAEGYGRHQGREFIHYLQIAYGSANEVENWLTLALDVGLLTPDLVTSFNQLNEEVLRMLGKMLSALREKSSTRIGEALEEYYSIS